MSDPRAASRPITPLSDEVLVDLFSIPPGVANWLHGWESRLRNKRDDMVAAVGSVAIVRVIGEVQSELDFLIDNPNGQFRRMLRRPLTQLGFASPARTGFEHAGRLILERADKAIEANKIAARCKSADETLSTEFETLAPNKLSALRARYQVEGSRIALLRRGIDGIHFLERVAQVRTAMDAWIATAAEIPNASTIADDKGITATELAALHAHAIAARDKLRRVASLAASVRESLKNQIADLADIAPRATTESGFVGLESLLEASLHQIVNCADVGDREWCDAPLWAIATLAVGQRRLGESEEFTWRPAVWQPATRRSPHEPLDQSTLRAIPLGDEIVFISRNLDSAVRIWNTNVALGTDAECQIAPDDIQKLPSALCARDVSALFGGVDTTHSRWYESTRHATVRIIAAAPDGWYARITRQGLLSAASRAPWMEPEGADSFLISLPARRRSGDQIAEEVAKLEPQPLATLFGLATYDAATGIAGHSRAWLRTTAGRWSGGSAALAREHCLFEALDRAVSGAGLKPLTTARLRGGRTPYPVYALPTAFIAPDIMQLRKWVTTGSAALFSLLQAIADVVVASHNQGFVIGVISLECFAYSATARFGSSYPIPTVVLAQAPLATRLGDSYSVPPEPPESSPPRYPVFGLPLLTPPLADRTIATETDDMFGFAALLIDLLLGRAPNGAPAFWPEFIAKTQFNWEIASRNSSIMQGVTGAVRTVAGRTRLLTLCREIAAGSRVGLQAIDDALSTTEA